MRKFYKLFLLLLSAGVITACSKENNEQLFDRIPDPEFRKVLIGQFDSNQDFTLSNEEIKAAKELNLIDKNEIRLLTGIEVFSNLEKIYIRNISVYSIDLSNNLNLKEISAFEIKHVNTIYLPISLQGIINTGIEAPPTVVIYK